MRIGVAGRLAEKHELAALGADPTPASGATDRARGDGEKAPFLFEVKSTVSASLPVTLADLAKTTNHAQAIGLTPALVLSFTDAAGTPLREGSWVCIPRLAFLELIEDG